MNPTIWLLGLLAAGACIGTLSGMLGIGGGVLVIPILTFFFGFSHRMAVGTSLAMLLPPIGALAVLDYWQHDNINIKAAAVLALSFAIGAWLGSKLVNHEIISEAVLRRLFGFFLIYVASNMIFRSDSQVWAVIRAISLLIVFIVPYFLAKWIGVKWERGISPMEYYKAHVYEPSKNDFEI